MVCVFVFVNIASIPGLFQCPACAIPVICPNILLCACVWDLSAIARARAHTHTHRARGIRAGGNAPLLAERLWWKCKLSQFADHSKNPAMSWRAIFSPSSCVHRCLRTRVSSLVFSALLAMFFGGLSSLSVSIETRCFLLDARLLLRVRHWYYWRSTNARRGAGPSRALSCFLLGESSGKSLAPVCVSLFLQKQSVTLDRLVRLRGGGISFC